MTDSNENHFIGGLIVGLILMILIWIAFSDMIENSKIKAGYLTYKDKTYKVTLYDTLDTPEKDAE